ncbi:unnamed protein product [Acanthosepion pharaonis]|uniref:Uncharacterized protein n=1 Tax=Acanthosepion pharaonis TaxID=158019 RepID=A0A812BQR7_ACAPH|nr:unnamed protein product [Sepia pharaonis]
MLYLFFLLCYIGFVGYRFSFALGWRIGRLFFCHFALSLILFLYTSLTISAFSSIHYSLVQSFFLLLSGILSFSRSLCLAISFLSVCIFSIFCSLLLSPFALSLLLSLSTTLSLSLTSSISPLYFSLCIFDIFRSLLLYHYHSLSLTLFLSLSLSLSFFLSQILYRGLSYFSFFLSLTHSSIFYLSPSQPFLHSHS